jgi:hypothetical protein
MKKIRHLLANDYFQNGWCDDLKSDSSTVTTTKMNHFRFHLQGQKGLEKEIENSRMNSQNEERTHGR